MAQNITTNTCTGTTTLVPPYFTEQDNGVVCGFQSITSHQDYRNLSLEELRLKDYSLDKGVVARPSEDTPLEGLVKTSIPLGLASSRPKLCKVDLAFGSNPYNSKTILCRVGKEDAQEFIVHEHLLVANSEYAQTALKKEWNEASEGVFSLPEDDINSFDLYQQWLYTGKIYVNRVSNQLQDRHHYERLVRAYTLGEKLIDCNFKDAIVDCIISRLRSVFWRGRIV